jgi:hypothetical protein
MTLVMQRLGLVLMLALGMSTVWVAASAWSAPGTGLAAAAYAQDDDDDEGDDDGGDDGDDDGSGDDDGTGDDDGGSDDGGDDGDDDRDDGVPEGGVDTGKGGTADEGGLPGATVLVPASLAGLAVTGGGLLLWRRRMAES